jgi:hypothetical protein
MILEFIYNLISVRAFHGGKYAALGIEKRGYVVQEPEM